MTGGLFERHKRSVKRGAPVTAGLHGGRVTATVGCGKVSGGGEGGGGGFVGFIDGGDGSGVAGGGGGGACVGFVGGGKRGG